MLLRLPRRQSRPLRFKTAKRHSGTTNLKESECLIPKPLKHSGSYCDAVERNILAGGDSAGRSILIGAIMGRVHGVATQTGIPLSWVLQLDDGVKVWGECERLAKNN